MNGLAKIACRTVGAVGLAATCYDAAKISKYFAEVGGEHAQEHYLEKAYFSSRTLDKVSYNTNVLREKTFEMRSRNPLPALWGKIKGGFKGLMYGLGNELPMVICSALALLGKNIVAKAGVIGIGAIVAGKILCEGFGIGKSNPMH